MSRYGGYGYGRYVSVAERRAKAAKTVDKLRASGRIIKPVEIAGRAIAKSFWGKAWCTNLESYSDYENRLPRGRTYARNGSVLDLQIKAGRIEALVNGSDLYKVSVQITALSSVRWREIRSACAGQIDSLVELLSGTLSKGVMEVVSRRDDGLFPSPSEIKLSCSCPDWAVMCKHVAATLYGVGARLDHEPGMLFILRGVDPADLIEEAIDHGVARPSRARGRTLDNDNLSSVFGVDIDFGDDPVAPSARPKQPKSESAKKAAQKKAAPKKATPKKAAPKKAAQKKAAQKKAAPKKATPKKAAPKKAAPKKATPKKAAPKKTAPKKTAAANHAKLTPSANRILEAVAKEPGIRGPALADRTHLAGTTVMATVAKLKKQGLMRFEGAPRERRYYLSEDTQRPATPDLTGLPTSAVRVFEAIAKEPGVRGPELTSQLHVSRSTVAGGIAKLKARGLVRFEGAPRTGGYYCASTKLHPPALERICAVVTTDSQSNTKG